MNEQNIQIKNGIFLKIYKIGAFLLALSLMLNCRAIWGSLTNNTIIKPITLFVCLISGIFLSLISVNLKNIPISKNNVIVLFFIIIYFLIYLLQPFNLSYLRDGFLSLTSCILIYVYILFFIKSKPFMLSIQYYINIMTLIGMISLFFWLFGSTLGIIKPTRLLFSNWGSTPTPVYSYYGLYFETQHINGIIRNSAVFTEAPMASLNFIIALVFQNLFNQKDRHHIFKEVILILSVLSTISSTGYIALLILFILNFIFKPFKNKTVLMPFALILLGIAVLIIHYLLFAKLGSESGAVRADDFRAGYMAWKLHPFMGAGINSMAYQSFISNWRSDNLGFSNTIMKILYTGGIYMLFPYLTSIIYGFFTSWHYHNVNNIILIILTSFLFITTIFSNTYILFFLFIFIFLNPQISNS